MVECGGHDNVAHLICLDYFVASICCDELMIASNHNGMRLWIGQMIRVKIQFQTPGLQNFEFFSGAQCIGWGAGRNRLKTILIWIIFGNYNFFFMKDPFVSAAKTTILKGSFRINKILIFPFNSSLGLGSHSHTFKKSYQWNCIKMGYFYYSLIWYAIHCNTTRFCPALLWGRRVAAIAGRTVGCRSIPCV